MSKIFNKVKGKRDSSKKIGSLKIILICALALLLISSVTLAWYINNLKMWGMEFNTGNIDFNAYVYDQDGKRVAGPVSPTNDAEGTGELESQYINAPLITIDNAEKGSISTAYIAVESTGSIGIQYRLIFDITGRTEKSAAYLGGYKYNISKVTENVTFSGSGNLGVADCPNPSDINDEAVTIDKSAINGTIKAEQEKQYDVYRIDFTLVHKNEEYTGAGINIYFNILATQDGGDFESTEERGRTYYCASEDDIDRACVEAYPGDIIKLSSDIDYHGDLVFNKAVNLETNDCVLTVHGNLIYDYVLNTSLKLNVGGLGQIVVMCSKDGVGGNFQIKAPLSEVTLIGSNATNGDIVVQQNIVIDATNGEGTPGVSFNEIRIIDNNFSRKTIQLDSNTRATVSFGTTIGILKSVWKANNIEIINNGTVGQIDLSTMELLEQTNSPQIYILNNSRIEKPIVLPDWSEPFVEIDGVCSGNTKIVQSISGNPMNVTGSSGFTLNDIEVERKDFLVEQIVEGNDSRLRIYYQDLDGQVTSIQTILENYIQNEATTGTAIYEILELEIVSIGDKAINIDDIRYMNSDVMQSLKHLNMEKANIYDRETNRYHRLPNNAFQNNNKYETLVLPKNLVAIGDRALHRSDIKSIITIPSGVTEFGIYWFTSGDYVHFASSVPLTQAVSSISDVKAIFVDETYITSYKEVYSGFTTRIYPMSVMDDSKTHFVRSTKDDGWEITHYIGGDEAVIGENVTKDGVKLRITSVYENAYRHYFTGTTVRFADSVEILGNANFYKNASITEVDLNQLRFLGDDTFSGASVLAGVSFGTLLETIGTNAFLNCVNLAQELKLPDTMESIGGSAFRNTGISTVHTGGAKVIGDYAFYDCTNLIYAELPHAIEVGANGSCRVFMNDKSLVSVKMPAHRKASGAYMFNGCVSLREVYMAATDEDISLGGNPFTNCDKTKLKMYVPEENLAFYQSKCPGQISATMIYPQGEKMGEQAVNGFNIGEYIVGRNSDGTYTLITSNLEYSDSLEIPETFNGKPITKIYTNAFRNQSFTNVTLKLGDSITSIGNSAFYQLGGIVKVEFGNSLRVIETSAFENCGNLKQDIVLPTSMERIGSAAFRNSGIFSIHTGGTGFVDGNAFANCKSLVYVIMPEVTTIGETGGNTIFYNCTSLVSVDFPELVKVYGGQMFSNCTALLEIYMGSDDATASLGSDAFKNVNSSQVKLFVPENLLSFYRDKKLVSIQQVYPRGEKLGGKTVNGFVIGDYVVLENSEGYTLVTSNLSFEGTVVVPDEYNEKPITEIYENAFRNQTFTDANLVLGDNTKTIGDNVFYEKSGLKSIVMDQVTIIGATAFYKSGIQVLNAPKLVSVGNSAFAVCTNLEMVSIPKIVTIDSTNVFAGCTSLKSVYFEDVMSLDGSTFSKDVNLENITINRLINPSKDNMPAEMSIPAEAPCKIYVPYLSKVYYTDTWSKKPVEFFDLSATYNGDTYILSDYNGRYDLIHFVPGQMPAELIIPDSVSVDEVGDVSIYSISAGAFAKVADTLKTLTLSATIAQLDNAALSECTSLENIYVSNGNVNFSSVSGVLYSKDEKMLVKYPVGREDQFNMTDAAYAATLRIGAGAFANATKLNHIVLPKELMVIDSSAFTNCPKLATVEFTGNTPPFLMGAGIFSTKVENFKVLIPTEDAAVISAYLAAYNYDEYVPYMVLNKNAVLGNMELSTQQVEMCEKIVSSALSYVGCPYVYGGTTPEGFDCSGFVQYVYQQNGYSVNRTATEQLSDGYVVSYEYMQPGDIVYFGYEGTATHVGIYIGDGNFVHAQNTATGVVISSLEEAYYANRFLCVHRVVE